MQQPLWKLPSDDTFLPGIMKKTILIYLYSMILLVALSLPVHARVLVGLAQTGALSRIDQSTLDQLGQQLTASSGAEVQFRGFDNDAAVTNWLMRFQEIDAAIVSPGFIKQQPAGALNHLVDLHTRDSKLPPLSLVVRSNLNSTQRNRIKEAFLKVEENHKGRLLLEKLGVSGISLPGQALKHQAVEVVTASTESVKEKSPPPAKKEQTAKAQPSRKKTSLSAEQSPVKRPAVTEAKTPQVKEETTAPQTPSPELTSKTLSKPVIAKATPPKEEKQQDSAGQEQNKDKSGPKISTQPADARQQPLIKPQPTPPRKQTELPASEPATNKRMILFVAMVLLLVILAKISLFVMRWRNKRQLVLTPEEVPTIEPDTADREANTTASVAEPASCVEKVVIEAGRLGPGKVPELLKRCADLPKPVVLLITKGPYEKLVYFAGGQVSGALTQNSTTSEPEVRWDKLGTLLVREELISSDANKQGMALLKEEPELRFGEALLKLGLIDLAGLRHALTRQAKVTIFSLILFPEGRYQIIAGDGSLPAEESISLEINSLLREASQHQSEWTAIRQALPSLNKALDFTAEGRSKLENVSLSTQQEATLSQINGTSTINEICVKSAMMDYELFRFLYLMVKAGVLA